jgi:hypothetical protein
MGKQQKFRERIKTGLQDVEASIRRLHRLNLTFIIAAILGSVASTLVA